MSLDLKAHAFQLFFKMTKCVKFICRQTYQTFHAMFRFFIKSYNDLKGL